MNKRIHLSGVILLTGLLQALGAKEKPNLLFIMVDDLGCGQCAPYAQDLTVEQFDPYFKKLVARREAYEPEEALAFSRRAMPTLSKLSEHGMVFTRAFSATSLCASSRLSIATGMNQQPNGIYTNMDVERNGLQPGTHLAEKLQAAGYASAHIGKWHVAARDDRIINDALDRHGIKERPDFWTIRQKYPEVYDEIWEAGYYGSVRKHQNPLQNGFDYYYGYNTWASQFYNSPLVWENYEHAGRQAGYNTEVFTDKAIGFIQDALKEEKPFFVQLHYHAVHDYLEPNAPDQYMKFFSSTSYELRNFYAHVYAVDRNIQRMVNLLEKDGVLDNTLMVFTSDNGAMAGGPSVLPGNAPFSGHKGMFNQGGIRVPLIFYWPDGIKQGRRLDQMVSSMDILPTFLDAAGVAAPPGLDGISLLPLLTTNSNREVRSQMVWSGIHARRWGFLINTSFKNHYNELPFAPGGWAVARGDYVLRFVGPVGPNVYHESPDGAPGRYSLFNYVEDPAETTDLIETMPELAEALKAEYLKKTETFAPPASWNIEKWKEIAGRAAVPAP